MRGLETYQRRMKGLPAGITAAEAEAERTQLLSLEVMQGENKGVQCSDVTELFIRVRTKDEEAEKSGFYYTQNLEEDPREALKRAAENAAFAAKETSECFLSPEEAWKPSPKDEAYTAEAVNTREVPFSVLEEKAHEMEAVLRRENPGAQILLRLIQTKETRGLINSLGTEMEAAVIRFEAEMEFAEEQGGVPYFYSICQSSEKLEDLQAVFFLKQIRKRRNLRLPKGTLEAGEYPAVLDCETAANLFATAWQMFTAKNYLADATPYAGRLGEKVTGEAVSIRNLPSIPEGGYRCVFDCEGSGAEPLELVKNGVLEELMQTVSTARAMGKSPTGTTGRKALLSGNIHTDLIPMPANFRLEKGERETELLLKEMGNGVYVTESFDVFHSINIASGEFHVPCRGILVENGECKACVEGITINGTIQDLLRDTLEVGSEVQVRPMDLLKSYTVCAPAMRIRSLNVTGSQS